MTFLSVLEAWSRWERPAALGLLLLPLLLLLWLRRPRAPEPRATGTLALWREVSAERERRARGPSRRLPPRLLWLFLALVAGTLAIAGPGRGAEGAPRLWRFEVDRSPSMFLRREPGGSETRYEAALAACTAWLDGAGVPGDARLWRSEGAPEVRAASPPPEWSRPPRAPAPEPLARPSPPGGPRWNLVTDAEPPGGWPGAGVVAAGGAAVPGAIGEVGGRRLLWDGTSVLESEEVAPRRLRLADTVPDELATLARLWAAERSVELVDAGEAELELAPRAGEAGAEVEGGRDGWTLRVRGRAGADPPASGLTPWLSAGEGGASLDGAALVRAGPGRIQLGFDRILERRGDEAAFALSWSELLDRCLLPAPGVVSLAERRSAGAPSLRDPVPSAGPAPPSASPVPPAAWLAAIAALGALLAFYPGRGRARPRQD